MISTDFSAHRSITTRTTEKTKQTQLKSVHEGGTGRSIKRKIPYFLPVIQTKKHPPLKKWDRTFAKIVAVLSLDPWFFLSTTGEAVVGVHKGDIEDFTVYFRGWFLNV